MSRLCPFCWAPCLQTQNRRCQDPRHQAPGSQNKQGNRAAGATRAVKRPGRMSKLYAPQICGQWQLCLNIKFRSSLRSAARCFFKLDAAWRLCRRQLLIDAVECARHCGETGLRRHATHANKDTILRNRSTFVALLMSLQAAGMPACIYSYSYCNILKSIEIIK